MSFSHCQCKSSLSNDWKVLFAWSSWWWRSSSRQPFYSIVQIEFDRVEVSCALFSVVVPVLTSVNKECVDVFPIVRVTWVRVYVDVYDQSTKTTRRVRPTVSNRRWTDRLSKLFFSFSPYDTRQTSIRRVVRYQKNWTEQREKERENICFFDQRLQNFKSDLNIIKDTRAVRFERDQVDYWQLKSKEVRKKREKKRAVDISEGYLKVFNQHQREDLHVAVLWQMKFSLVINAVFHPRHFRGFPCYQKIIDPIDPFFKQQHRSSHGDKCPAELYLLQQSSHHQVDIRRVVRRFRQHWEIHQTFSTNTNNSSYQKGKQRVTCSENRTMVGYWILRFSSFDQ